MKKLDTLTYSLAENCLSKNNLFEAKLILNWDKIFSKYSSVIKPMKVQFIRKNNKNGTLILEVQKGYECGLTIQNFNDIKVGDIIEVFDQISKN